MRKRKVIKKALPFALAVVLLLSMFALGASAKSYVDYVICDCIMEREVSVENIDCTATKLVVECPECAMVYQIEMELLWINGDKYYDPSCCTDYSYCLVDGEAYDYGDGVFVLTHFYNPEFDCDGGVDFKVNSVNVLSSIVDSPSVVGNMTGTITNALGGILLGVGGGIVQFFDNTVLDSNGNLTTFAIWALAFLGIAFALGVVKFITFLVKRK